MRKKKRVKLKQRAARLLPLFLAALLLSACIPSGSTLWRQLCTASGFGSWEDTPNWLEIHLIDVGKADAILIKSQDCAALLDAGYFASSGEIVDYLSRQGVQELDYLIMSHPDRDHIGGMAQLMEEVSVGEFISAPLSKSLHPDSLEYADLELALETHGVPCRVIRPGESFFVGRARLNAVGPLKRYDSTNDSSLVLRLTCGEFSALFCGDMEKEAEEDLIRSKQDLRADLLKVGHHGSKTSSSLQFLYEVSPKYAAISTGPDRSRLPREEILAQLEQVGAEIYRTDTDGDIVFMYDGKTVTIEIEKEKERLADETAYY